MGIRQDASIGPRPTWSDALAASMEWIPTLDGSYDSRAIQSRGRSLLAALMLVVARRDGAGATMSGVRRMIDRETTEPKSVLAELGDDPVEEVREIARHCLAARGCWFGDAVPFLSLTVGLFPGGAVGRSHGPGGPPPRGCGR